MAGEQLRAHRPSLPVRPWPAVAVVLHLTAHICLVGPSCGFGSYLFRDLRSLPFVASAVASARMPLCPFLTLKAVCWGWTMSPASCYTEVLTPRVLGDCV